MRRIRRSQDELRRLSPLARFLNHVATQRGVTQTVLANALAGVSLSTVSRWFRDEAMPTADELRAVAPLLGVSADVLQALTRLDDRDDAQPLLSCLGTWPQLAGGSRDYVLMCGFTLVLGIVPLRDTALAGRTLLVSLIDPLLERSPYDDEPGADAAMWLASVAILQSLARRQNGPRLRLWLRSTLEVGDQQHRIGQLIATDTVAIESSFPWLNKSFRLHYENSPRWNEIVAPLRTALASDQLYPNHNLVWDSTWKRDDPRSAQFEDLRRTIVDKLTGTNVPDKTSKVSSRKTSAAKRR